MELLNLSTIKSSKDSFVDSKLKSHFIDMLFSVSLNNQEIYLYFLFEHKSSPEKDVTHTTAEVYDQNMGNDTSKYKRY